MNVNITENSSLWPYACSLHLFFSGESIVPSSKVTSYCSLCIKISFLTLRGGGPLCFIRGSGARFSFSCWEFACLCFFDDSMDSETICMVICWTIIFWSLADLSLIKETSILPSVLKNPWRRHKKSSRRAFLISPLYNMSFHTLIYLVTFLYVNSFMNIILTLIFSHYVLGFDYICRFRSLLCDFQQVVMPKNS